MSSTLFTGPRMPRDLLDKIGAPQKRQERPPNGRYRTAPADRKQRRKMEREGKRKAHAPQRREHGSKVVEKAVKEAPHRIPSRPATTRKEAKAEASNDEESLDEKEADEDDFTGFEEQDTDSDAQHAPPSASKRKRQDLEDPAPRKKSRKEEEDDAEIVALQKKLGIKSKKLPKSFDDGLGDLLGDLDDGSDEGGEGEYETWLRQKRQQPSKSAAAPADESDEDDDLDKDGLADGFNEDSDSALDELDEERQEKPPARQRENPYVAPVVASSTTEKYVPPSMRQASASNAETQARLKRQIKGQVNRLSEANILSILAEIEKLYTSNPRQYVTSGLIELLIELTSDPSVLNDTFLILHAGFIAAVYKVIGPDFGAQFLDRFVQRFDHCYAAIKEDNDSSKSATNMMSLLSHLYNFQVVSSIVIFDYLRLFLATISEPHTELLLRIVRSSGHQLRQDDPSALKDIAAILKRSASCAGENAVSVRTQFMVETITSLKDNRLKQSAASSALMAEQLTRMRKSLGTLNSRTLRATEPLSISLADIRDADKRGKWWLVGASWKGAASASTDASTTQHLPKSISTPTPAIDQDIDADVTTDLIALARLNKMTTPLRQTIFATLLSSTDYRDASTRLAKLNLTNKQRLDIPRVILHCAGAESAYNPFWGLLARRLCAERALGKAFLFGAFGLYRRFGASTNDDGDESDEDEDAGKPSLRETLNLAKLFAELLADRAVPITLLKHLDLPSLPRRSRARTFAEVLLVSTVLRIVNRQRAGATGKEALRAAVDGELCTLFGVGRNEGSFAVGLRWFLERVVKGSDLVKSEREGRALRKACGMLLRRLSDGNEMEDAFDDDDE